MTPTKDPLDVLCDICIEIGRSKVLASISQDARVVREAKERIIQLETMKTTLVAVLR